MPGGCLSDRGGGEERRLVGSGLLLEVPDEELLPDMLDEPEEPEWELLESELLELLMACHLP